MAYHRVWSSIWTERWTEDARTLALYLLTCEHRVTEGLFRLPKQYISADLGWPAERVQEAFGELLNDGFLLWDGGAQVILLTGALKRQAPPNPNAAKAAVRAIEGLPETPLLRDLYRLAERFSERFAERLRERFPDLVLERFSQEMGDPPAPPPTPTPTPRSSRNLETLRVGEKLEHHKLSGAA